VFSKGLILQALKGCLILQAYNKPAVTSPCGRKTFRSI
jgi:hypothetical protein